ncbi:TonB-dependent receptor domain-containing protein [Sphingomonas sp.]|uniref:TonB-dependent receptor n=1 Tax=Sphingomonas sp. TaxID=28214 RepID=UPI00286A7786|nr:TonB-dependent receptor [Sphingomonas sp.]
MPIDVAPVEQAIIITGHGLEADDKLAAARIIDRAAIERSASGRLEDVLRDVAGLASFRRSDSRSAHPTSQGLTLRGLGGNAASRVTLSLDGVPQADPFGGWIAFGAIDPHAIDRIRVVRGGGIDGLAGNIEIDSRKPDHSIAGLLSGGSRSSFEARGFGGVQWASGFASLSGNFGRGDGFVPVVAADRGAADERAPYRQGGGRVRLVQSLGSDVEAQFSLSTYRDRRSRGTDFSFSRQHGTDASVRLVGRGGLRWSALAYAQQRTFDTQFAAVNASRSAASLTLDQHVPARGVGARLEVQPKIGAVRLTAGAEWRRVTGKTDEDFRFIAGSPTRTREAGGRNVTAGLFGGAAWSAGGWSLAGDVRADHWTMAEGRLIEADLSGALLTNSRFDRRSGWEWSGRIAAGRKLSDALALRTAAYHSWRLPTLNELYRPFRAGADATAANAALDPERLRGVEAGVDWTPVDEAKLSATAFANRLSGAISNVSLGRGPGVFPGVGFVAAGGVYRARQNVDAIDSRGVEIDGTLQRGAWRAELSYAFTDARVRASGQAAALDGKRPAQVARHSGSASLGWASSKLSLDATARLTGRQFEDDSNSRALPAALTFDGVGRVNLNRHIGIGLRAENIFDQKVIATLAADGTRERALPRTLWIELKLR